MRVKYTRVSRVRDGNRVTLKRGGGKAPTRTAIQMRKEKQNATKLPQEKKFNEIKKKLENKNKYKNKSSLKFIEDDPIEYFMNICVKNAVSKDELEDLIKDKHALDNQHDFTADRGDFSPDANFIYYINDLYNKSYAEVSSDISIPVNIPGAIFKRNQKMSANNIRFADLEWDTFRYFSRKLFQTFSCSPESGIVFKEISIKNLIKPDDGTLNIENLANIQSEPHIVINTSEFDPTKKLVGDKLETGLISLAQIYLSILGLSDSNIYLNFDAKTKGTLSKPFAKIDKVKQLLTYQNLYDSGNNMFSILSDDTATYPKTELVKQENALNSITSNYFSRHLGDRSYTMEYVLNKKYNLDHKTTKEGIDNILNWVAIKVSATNATPEIILQTSPAVAGSNIQRGGPGVAVLAKYIDKYKKECQDRADKVVCMNGMEKNAGFDTVRLSELLGKATSLSDVIKLCVDIKGGGDAEQVNAVWQFNRTNKTASCILVTGDILCYMYSIIMGIPSILIIQNKIYISKGIPKEPPPQFEVESIKIHNHTNMFLGIIKTITDIAKGNNNLDILMGTMKNCVEYEGVFTFGEQIQTDLEFKYKSISSIDKIKKTITYLIQLKLLDIINYLNTMHKIINPKVSSRILPIVERIFEEYKGIIEVYSKIFTIQTIIKKTINVSVFDTKLREIDELIKTIKGELQEFDKILGNFKNKTYDGTSRAFYNGIVYNNFIDTTGTTTIPSYSLFNYDRDSIYKLFAVPLYKIMTLEPADVRNPRAYLAKELRAAFQKYFESFFTFKMIDYGLGSGFFPVDIFGSFESKDVRECNVFKSIFVELSDEIISSSKQPDICAYIDKFIDETKRISLKSYIDSLKPAGAAGATFGGNLNLDPKIVEYIQTKLEKIIDTSKDILLKIKEVADVKIITTEPFISEEIKLTNVEIEQVGLSELKDCFKEILQDAYIFSMNQYINEEQLDDFYRSVYNKWIDGIMDIEAVHSYDCTIHKTAFLNPNTIDASSKLLILQMLTFIYNNALIQDKNIIGIYEIIQSYIKLIPLLKQLPVDIQKQIITMSNSVDELSNNINYYIRTQPLQSQQPIGLYPKAGIVGTFGGRRAKTSSRSYGEKSLTKMLKDINLNKSKKRQLRKTIKNNKN